MPIRWLDEEPQSSETPEQRVPLPESKGNIRWLDEKSQQPEEPTTFEKYVRPVLGDTEVYGINPFKVATDVVGGAYQGLKKTSDEVSRFMPSAYNVARSLKNIGGFLRGEDKPPVDVKTIEERLPDYKPEYEAISETSQILLPSLVGGVGGYRAASYAAKAINKAPFVIKTMGTALGEALGETLSKNRGENRLLFGKESLAGIETGISDDKEFGQFINDYLDAVTIATGAMTVGDVLVRGLSAIWNGWAKPAINIWKPGGSRQKEFEDLVMNTVIQKMGILRNAKTVEDRVKAIRDLAKTLRDNGEVVFETDKESIKIIRDTLSAIERGADPEDTVFINTLRELRRGHLGAGYSPKTQDVTNIPSRTITEEFIPSREKIFGGMEGIEKAEEGIQQQARKMFEEGFERPVEQLEEKLVLGRESLSKLLKEDPSLRKAFTKLNDNVTLDIDQFKNKTIDEIREILGGAYDTMKKKMDDLVDKIPEGVIIDTSPVDDLVEDSISISSQVKKAFNDSGGDFKKLYTNVLPKITREIDGKLASNNGDVGDLIELKEFINRSGPTKEFREYYKKEWAPVWVDGKLREFGELHRTFKRRGIRPYDYEVKTGEIISKIPDKPPYSEQLLKLLERPEAGKNPELATNLFLGDVASRLQKELNTGKTLKEIDIDSYLSALHGSSLPRINPVATKRIEDFLTKLRDSKLEIPKIERQLAELVKDRDKAQDIIFNNMYKEFFDKFGKPSKTGFKSFETLLSSPGNKDRISEIIDTAIQQGDEDILNGMKSAYLRYFRNTMFAKQATMKGGAKKADVEAFRKMVEKETPILEYGEEIFKDTPNLFKALIKLQSEAVAIEKSLTGSERMVVISPVESAIQSSRSLDRFITMFIGVLNRIAVRFRSMKGLAVELLDPEELIKTVIDDLLSNPKEAEKVLTRIIKQEQRGIDADLRLSLEGFVGLLSKELLLDNEVEIVNEMQQEMEKTPRQTVETEKLLSK